MRHLAQTLMHRHGSSQIAATRRHLASSSAEAFDWFLPKRFSQQSFTSLGVVHESGMWGCGRSAMRISLRNPWVEGGMREETIEGTLLVEANDEEQSGQHCVVWSRDVGQSARRYAQTSGRLVQQMQAPEHTGASQTPRVSGVGARAAYTSGYSSLAIPLAHSSSSSSKANPRYNTATSKCISLLIRSTVSPYP